MTVPIYRRLSLAVRPVRLAFLVPSTASPQDLTQMVARFTECWGGAYFLPIPVRGGNAIAPAFWRVLRAYDPDRVAGDPRPADDILRCVFDECCLQEWDDVKTWLDAFENRSSRLDWHAVSMSRYLAEREKLEARALQRVDRIVSRLGDPRADLVVAARYGIMSDEYWSVVGQCGFPKEQDVTNARDALRRAWELPELKSDVATEPTWPFSVTLWGCRWYSRIQVDPSPFVVVIGDSAEDFCLYYCLSRLLGRAAWWPPSILDERTPLADAWRDGVTTAAQLPGAAALPMVTSVSCTEAACRSALVRNGVKDWDEALFCQPEDVPLVNLCWLWDREQVEVPRHEPFVGGSAVAPLPPLRPTLMASLPLQMGDWPNQFRPNWFIDVDVEAWQAPVRGCMRGLISVDAEWGLRVSRVGISYNSQAQGLERNVREDALIAQPRVAAPDVEEMFARLAQNAGVEIQKSAVGAFAAGSASLWGSMESFAWALREGKSLTLLEGYVRDPPKENEEVAGRWLPLSRRWFLTFDNISSLVGGDAETARVLVDDWLGRGILRRGLVLKCPVCRCTAWYAIDDLGQRFRCARCREESTIARGTWIENSADAPWAYDLHEIVYQAVRLDCRAPVLTLAALQVGARAGKFHYLHEQEVVLGPDESCEVDLWAIVEGRVVIGEAKATDRLGNSKAEETKVLNRLARVADLLTADVVLFASTAQWRDATRDLVEKMFKGHRSAVRFFDDAASNVLRL